MDGYIESLNNPDVNILFDQVLGNQSLYPQNFTPEEKLYILNEVSYCGNQNDNITEDNGFKSFTAYKAHRIVSMYVFPVFLFSGIILNVASIKAFKQRIMRYQYASTNAFMKTLAVTDILFLLFGILTKWLGDVADSNVQEKSNFLCKSITFVSYTNSHLSVWLIVAVTVERCLIACQSQIIQKDKRLRRAKITLAVLVLTFIIINAHLLWTVELTSNVYRCKVVTKCLPKPEYSKIIRNVWTVIDSCIYSFVPTIIIIINNIIIIWKMHFSASREMVFQFNRNLPAKKKRMRNFKITVMSLVVSFTFVLTTFPMSITLIIMNALHGHKYEPSTLAEYWLVRTITDCFMYINHSINFLLYCFANKDFRNALTRAVRRRSTLIISVTGDEKDDENHDDQTLEISTELHDLSVKLEKEPSLSSIT